MSTIVNRLLIIKGDDLKFGKVECLSDFYSQYDIGHNDIKTIVLVNQAYDEFVWSDQVVHLIVLRTPNLDSIPLHLEYLLTLDIHFIFSDFQNEINDQLTLVDLANTLDAKVYLVPIETNPGNKECLIKFYPFSNKKQTM